MVMGIFALLSTAVYGNYRSYNTNVSLENLSHQIALLIRQAQVYGISVTQQNQKGFGAYFSSGLNDNKSFPLFDDINGNKTYDSSNNESLEEITIRSGDFIAELCINPSTPTGTCPSGQLLSNLHIIFIRPNPEAVFQGVYFTSGNPTGSEVASAKIVIQSPNGSKRKIVVWNTGQIAVEKQQ